MWLIKAQYMNSPDPLTYANIAQRNPSPKPGSNAKGGSNLPGCFSVPASLPLNPQGFGQQILCVQSRRYPTVLWANAWPKSSSTTQRGSAYLIAQNTSGTSTGSLGFLGQCMTSPTRDPSDFTQLSAAFTSFPLCQPISPCRWNCCWSYSSWSFPRLRKAASLSSSVRTGN